MPRAHPRSPGPRAYPGDMTSQQPGRLPASVYRRRRLVVGLGVLAVIVVIVLLIVRPGAGDDDATKPDASDSPAPSASEPTAADESAPCDPASIVLTPVTDKDSYQPGETPMISMKVKNAGAGACTFDVGTAAQLYEIV